jgi:hypothetical protein
VEKIYAKFPRALPLKISHFLSCFVHTPISRVQAINKGRKQREVETSSFCTRKKEEKTRPRTRRARASLNNFFNNCFIHAVLCLLLLADISVG